MSLPGMGGFREVGDLSHCAADYLFVAIHPTKDEMLLRVFCLLFGELAFTAAGKCLVEPPSHTITRWRAGCSMKE